MRIEIRTAPGCPNAERAKTVVADCLGTLSIDVPIIELVGDYPSPTVLINGVDVMDADLEPSAGNACRLDLPTPQRVLDALRTSLRQH